MGAERIRQLAMDCGFELAGIAQALPPADFARYRAWIEAGFAGEMRYLTDHRAALRTDPRNLLPGARSVVCVGKCYNRPEPYSTGCRDPGRGWISRYAWGRDYHAVMRAGLKRLAARLREEAGGEFRYRIAVDTAPLLERSFARLAGLGWIGKNSCLIHERSGSWYFLGELLTTLELSPDVPPPDRCGTCTRCIEACPTAAIVPADSAAEGPAYTIDARLCIAYLTIERRGPFSAGEDGLLGRHVFGCDICQDVCPWNRRAPAATDPAFAARHYAPPLEELAALSWQEFDELFRGSPVRRVRYTGFLRNVAAAMGNAGLEKFRAPLERLAASPTAEVAQAARRALERLDRQARST